MRITKDIRARRDRHQADVVVRARTNAIEAKCAVNVPGFAREIKFRLATALMTVAAQTIMCLASGANVRLADFHFEWRNQGGHKLELTNRADVFAEACAAEERINGESRQKIVDDQPSRPDRLIPKAEDLVNPKERQEQHDREPF